MILDLETMKVGDVITTELLEALLNVHEKLTDMHNQVESIACDIDILREELNDSLCTEEDEQE